MGAYEWEDDYDREQKKVYTCHVCGKVLETRKSYCDGCEKIVDFIHDSMYRTPNKGDYKYILNSKHVKDVIGDIGDLKSDIEIAKTIKDKNCFDEFRSAVYSAKNELSHKRSVDNFVLNRMHTCAYCREKIDLREKYAKEVYHNKKHYHDECLGKLKSEISKNKIDRREDLRKRFVKWSKDLQEFLLVGGPLKGVIRDTYKLLLGIEEEYTSLGDGSLISEIIPPKEEDLRTCVLCGEDIDIRFARTKTYSSIDGNHYHYTCRNKLVRDVESKIEEVEPKEWKMRSWHGDEIAKIFPVTSGCDYIWSAADLIITGKLKLDEFVSTCLHVASSIRESINKKKAEDERNKTLSKEWVEKYEQAFNTIPIGCSVEFNDISIRRNKDSYIVDGTNYNIPDMVEFLNDKKISLLRFVHAIQGMKEAFKEQLDQRNRVEYEFMRVKRMTVRNFIGQSRILKDSYEEDGYSTLELKNGDILAFSSCIKEVLTKEMPKYEPDEYQMAYEHSYMFEIGGELKEGSFICGDREYGFEGKGYLPKEVIDTLYESVKYDYRVKVLHDAAIQSARKEFELRKIDMEVIKDIFPEVYTHENYIYFDKEGRNAALEFVDNSLRNGYTDTDRNWVFAL